MRRTILALAALAATSGFAMAKDTHVSKPHAHAVCSQTMTKQKLDCGTTGSISRDRHGGPVTTNSTGRTEPRLGIDINPWIVPSFN